MFIIGESALTQDIGEYIFETIKKIIIKNNFINDHWNALNIVWQQASRVGAIDLGIYSINHNDNFSFFNKLENNEFKFLYLLGADNINIKKKDMFVVYQGSHGDAGAEIADIVLPGAAYTEKDGFFLNLEGRLQKAFKASYPPGDAKEDWIIFQDIANLMNKPLIFKNKENLNELILNEIKEFSKSQKTNTRELIAKNITYVQKEIIIKKIDYYYTNPIARSSKTMNKCRELSKSFISDNISV